MANIVAGFGVPHTPVFPFFVKRDGPDCETAKLFAAQKEQLAAARPDVIVMFDTDHLNTFFLDNLPIFAVGVDKTFAGPNDEPREMPVYKIPSAVDLAAHIRQTEHRSRLRRRADAALLGRSLDRGAAAFPHAGNEGAGRSVLHQRPCPAAAVRATLLCAGPGGRARDRRRGRQPLRVVVMGSGSFSLEVAGPRMAPGRTDGVPDPDWACGSSS